MRQVHSALTSPGSGHRRGQRGNIWSLETLAQPKERRGRTGLAPQIPRTKCLFLPPENELLGPCWGIASPHRASRRQLAQKVQEEVQRGRDSALAARASGTPRGIHRPHIYLCELQMLMSAVEPKPYWAQGAIGLTLNTVFFVCGALGSNCRAGFGRAADVENCPGLQQDSSGRKQSF